MLEPFWLPGIQLYVLAPVALNVTEFPVQMLVLVADGVTVGEGFTVTTTV